MVRAPLGDDVFGEDPSILELEELASDMTVSKRHVPLPMRVAA